MSTAHSPVLMQKIIATLALVVAFLVMASLIVPHDSSAAEGQASHGQSDRAGAAPASNAAGEEMRSRFGESEDPHEGLACLGTVESAGFEVQIYQTGRGVRYSVIDRSTGELRATLVRAEQVTEMFPELPIREMSLDQPLLMLADPLDLESRH